MVHCRHLLTIGTGGHVRMFEYDGNQLGSWHLPTLFPISHDCLSISNDTLAFLDTALENGQWSIHDELVAC